LKYYLARTEMSVIDNIAMDPRLHLLPCTLLLFCEIFQAR